ncbi:Plasma protease C1 inhibitor like [Actinidia chinensis var. chinensis]|uniref:Plasma protease C1 inhibitor like n=1 Tax=Actinidia chinensis var. chinensis TaxID=1590841 RepID=A0A2R6QJ17_ACTCC|nr:Plasma protease C1 inhibitor like [Actinidia chinensis var. chinensis]
MEVETRESDGVSIVVSSSIDRCSSYLKHKDEMGAVNTPEPTFWNKMPDTEGCRCTNTLSTFDFEDAPEELKFGSINESTLSMPSLEGKRTQRKSGKTVRSNSGCSKRLRMARIEGVSINEAEADNIKEKNQTAKQKNVLNGKRGDKRNCKVFTKGKYDYFSLKAGMVSFNSAAGGNNFLGIYGLKPDAYDVTAHLDELSVNELLNGSYKGLSFSKDKGKKSAILNDNILQSVRKACSVLRLHKPLKTKNSAEIDNSCNHKVSACPVSSNASVAGRNVGDRGDTCTADLSSYDKAQDSFSKPKTPDNVLDLPLCQPKDILERLALPPPKDLDSLLLDVAKLSVLLKNNSDSRGKQISQRATLSPSPWSHNSSGYGKSNSDVIKLSLSKTTCQGRWLKIGNTASSLEGKSDFLVDFESLTYDRSLVPLASLKCDPVENEIAPSTSVSFPCCELGSSSSAVLSIASQLPIESGSMLKCEGDEAHSPRSLAAAQSLCDIAAHSLKQELNGMVRWPKKPSEKTMKACKSKSNGKSGELFAAPKSVRLIDDQVTNASEMLPSKKPRLLGGDFGHNTERKGSTNWSVPRSSRPSPSKSFRDSVVETKSYNPLVVKQSCTMPPPPSSRVSDKACNSRQKLRKLVPVAWNREGGKLD